MYRKVSIPDLFTMKSSPWALVNLAVSGVWGCPSSKFPTHLKHTQMRTRVSETVKNYTNECYKLPENRTSQSISGSKLD